MSDSTTSSLNSEPQPATGLTRSPSQKYGTSPNMTMLSASEIESLRQETKQAMLEMRAYRHRIAAAKSPT